MKKIFFFLVMSFLSCAGFAQYIYTAVRMGGDAAYTGLATSHGGGQIETGVVFDVDGNMYFTEQINDVVRKVDTNGIISTIAGTGITGYNGDNIPATTANLSGPTGIALDANGDIYFCDYGNNRVRKIDIETGLISTVAGTGVYGYNGDNIAATSAMIKNPMGIIVDSEGSVYFADMTNNLIRRIDATSGIITNFAGTGAAGYGGDGNLATSATLHDPKGVEFDHNGDLFIADAGNHRIRKIDMMSGDIFTVAGNGGFGYNGDSISATNAQLYFPFDVAFDSYNNLYISDDYNKRVRMVDSTGMITTFAGGNTTLSLPFDGDGGLAKQCALEYARGVGIDAHNRVFITDHFHQLIRMVTDFNDTDDVWPGDANDDHVVNNYDLLPLGIYYSKLGQIRASTSTSWQGYPCANWWTNQQIGPNLKHIDCDGDAEITMYDTVAIHNNFNAIHAFIMPPSNGTRTTDPDIYFIPDNTSYTAGSVVNAELWIGTIAMPVTDLYGIAFDIGYNTTYVQPGSISISYPTGLLGAIGPDAMRVSNTNAVPGVVFGAITRVSGISVNGFGKIADLSFVANSNIDHVDSLHLTVSSYRAMNVGSVPKNLNIVPLETWNSAGIKNTANTDIGVYPNPSAGVLTVRYPSSVNGQKKTINVYNTLGKKVYSLEDASDKSSIDISNITPGIYMLSVETNGQVFKSRIIKE